MILRKLIMFFISDSMRAAAVKLSAQERKDQYKIFYEMMKPLVIWGECWGLMPIIGLFNDDPTEVRFHKKTLRFVYSLMVFLIQLAMAIWSSWYIYTSSRFDVGSVYMVVSYASASALVLLLLLIASNWPMLVQEISSVKLPVNIKIIPRFFIIMFIFIMMVVVQVYLEYIAKASHSYDCFPEVDPYMNVINKSYPFLFHSGVVYHPAIGFTMQIISLFGKIISSYSALLIISVSMYLTSALDEIRNSIRTTRKESANSSHWKSLRETYTRVTRLIRVFDDVINIVTLFTISTNLFIMCLRAHDVLVNGIQSIIHQNCINYGSGPFYGYELIVFFTYAVFHVTTRFLCVTFNAASVRYSSLKIAPALYEIPAEGYCIEVERFLEQTHNDKVTLTGYFFDVTRGLVLTVAAAAITNELVLMQLQKPHTEAVDTRHGVVIVTPKFNFTVPYHEDTILDYIA